MMGRGMGKKWNASAQECTGNKICYERHVCIILMLVVMLSST